MPHELETHLVALERRLLESDVRASAEALDRLLDDDFQEIGASGVRFGKAEALERLPREHRDRPPGEDPPRFGTYDFDLRILAPDVAQLLYRATIEQPDTPQLYSLRTSIWRRQGQRWRMVYHQGTRCTPFDSRAAGDLSTGSES